MKILVIFSLFAATWGANLPAAEFTHVSHKLEISNLSDEEIFQKYAENSRNGRLTNGFPVTVDSRYPFVTHNFVTWPDAATDFCTGAILSTTWTITARQCMFCDICNHAALSVVVWVGGATTSSANRRRHDIIQAVWVNSPADYNPDFALLMVTPQITITASASPIALPSFPQSLDFFENRRAVIASWGESVEGQLATGVHYADVTITNRASCSPAVIPNITSYEFCARSSPFLPVTLLDGDQGAPLALVEGANWNIFTLVGVVSTQRTSTAETNPLIMALRVGQFWQYIHEITGIPPVW